ncbi:hypothetical protein [Rhodococcoides fascians]|uniref:hypothetical protein n=1 Tax=Rhodococcoides fascians TaxID=1828 RepID=UPI0012D32795|nr:hypothetical protein [Rhodococcus fascians]
MIAELVHRWWRRSPWISSPLLRLSDRIERTAVSVGVAMLLLLIPVSATIGSVTYTDLSLRSQQQRAQNVRVDAHVIDAMKSARSDTDGVTTAVFVWFLGAVVIGGLVLLITLAGGRSRMRHWDRDWQHFLQARDHPSR